MNNRQMIKGTIALSAVFFLSVCAVFAEEIDDHFGPSRRIEGEHFTIYCASSLDVIGLSQQLNILPSDRILSGARIAKGHSGDEELASMADTLFIRVCDIMDMNLRSFKGSIKVCRDFPQLQQIYESFFSQALTHARSFYVYDLNTIYISADSFTREVLGHEIAHAVICHYFVVPPSVKIQEVLASYTEYQLRNLSQ